MLHEKPTLRLVIGIALLALTPFIALDEAWRYWQLVSDGIETPAAVTKLERRKGRRGWWASHFATYQFTDGGGRRWIGRQKISHDLYEVLAASKPKRQITVHYCRSKPDLNVISLTTLRNEFLMFGGIAVTAGALIFAIFLAERRENAGITAAIRRHVQYDRARRGPAIAGRPSEPQQNGPRPRT